MKIIAHRGNNIEKIENEIEGILKTLSYDYIDGIEIDIRMTKDNKLVLSHNLILRNIDDEVKNISKETLKKLQKDTFVRKKDTYKIETLQKLLKQIHTKKLIFIECKEEYGREKTFVKSLLKVINKHPNQNIIISSFSYSLLSYLQTKSKIKTALLIGYLLNTKKEYKKFDYLLLSPSSITHKTMQKPYYVWTINQKNQLNKILKNNNFIGIITDKGNLFHK